MIWRRRLQLLAGYHLSNTSRSLKAWPFALVPFVVIVMSLPSFEITRVPVEATLPALFCVNSVVNASITQLVHVAELATGPKFNQVATAVITMTMATKIKTLMANLRAVVFGFLSSHERLSRSHRDAASKCSKARVLSASATAG
jgi:hypothetical protein